MPIREKAGKSSALGHADLGGLRDRLQLGASDIRPAPQQIGRDAHDDVGRRDRDHRRTIQQVGQVAGRHAELNAQGIPRLAPLCLQGGYRGLGVQEHRPGLLDVELGDGSVLEPGFDDLQGLLLDLHVLAGDADALLGGPERDIGVRHVGGQRDERVVVVRERREQAGVGRLNAPPDPSPEVQLPAGLGPDLGLPVIEAATVGGGADEGSVARPVVLDGPGELLRLRKDLADRDAQLGAGLQDPHPGLLEREVIPIGSGDEAVQGRIVEGPPPVPVRGRLSPDPLVLGLPPVRRDGDLGPLVVRPDHASGEGQEHRDEEEEPASRPGCPMRQFRRRANLLSGHVTTQHTGSARTRQSI